MHSQQQENESGVVYNSLIVEPETTPFAQTASPISAIQQEEITLPELLIQTKQEVSKWRKRRRRTLGISAFLFPLSFVCMSLINFIPHNMTFMMLGFLMLMGSLFGLLAGILMRPLRNNPVHLLWESENVEAVGSLLEATQMLLPEIKFKALEGLVRLLPRMQASEADLLTSDQRNCLRHLLIANPIEQPHYPSLSLEGIPFQQIETMQKLFADRISQQRDLALGILHVFAHIGAGKEISLVSEVGAGRRTGAE